MLYCTWRLSALTTWRQRQVLQECVQEQVEEKTEGKTAIKWRLWKLLLWCRWRNSSTHRVRVTRCMLSTAWQRARVSLETASGGTCRLMQRHSSCWRWHRWLLQVCVHCNSNKRPKYFGKRPHCHLVTPQRVECVCPFAYGCKLTVCNALMYKCITIGRHMFPVKSARFCGGFGAPSNSWILGPAWLIPTNGILIGSAVKFCTAHPCAQHTDKQNVLYAASVATGHIFALHVGDVVW